MARYYFDVQNGKPLVRDDEGAEFDSLEAAVHAAARSAAEIGTSRLAKGDTSDVVIEVRDEQNQRVCTVPRRCGSSDTAHPIRDRTPGVHERELVMRICHCVKVAFTARSTVSCSSVRR